MRQRQRQLSTLWVAAAAAAAAGGAGSPEGAAMAHRAVEAATTWAWPKT